MTSNFKDFLVKNGIVSTAASITIGFATATFIKSFVADVIMPLIFLVIVGGLKHVNSDMGRFLSSFLSSKEMRFTNFASELVTWVLVVVAAFLVLDLVVRATIGKQPAMVKAPFGPPAQPMPMPKPMQVREEMSQVMKPVQGANMNGDYALW